MPVTKSPMRYPGGKTQLANFIRKTIQINNLEESTYIEAYAGGFGVGVELLLTNGVRNVVINDYDKSIYSVWYSILNNTDELISLIENTPITIKSWYEQKEIHLAKKNYRNSIEHGFSTLFLNRTNRSGIINAGPIGGYNQNSNYTLDCRFNKNKLIEKIDSIAEQRDRIRLYQKDAIKFISTIEKDFSPEKTFCFFDPPYYIQGKNLYTNFYNHNNHVDLANKIAKLEDYYWITTYDYSQQIQNMYSTFNNKQFKYSLGYSAQKKRTATEFLFASQKTKVISYDKVELRSV